MAHKRTAPSGTLRRFDKALPYDPPMRSLNPATGETIRECPITPPAEVDLRLAVAYDAFAEWRRRPMADRGRILRDAATSDEIKPRPLRPAHDRGDGQADRARPRRRSTSAPGSASTSPSTRRPILAPEAIATDAAQAATCAFDPLGVRARGDAVEFPVLAGVPLRGAGADGGQRRACSSTRRTCRAARSRSRRSSATPGRPTACSRTLLVLGTQAEALIDDRADRVR
mgnify:CR=1 FL=1